MALAEPPLEAVDAQPVAAGGEPLRVAVDVTSLLVQETGVAVMVRELTTRLGSDHGFDLTGLVVSRRAGGDLAEVMPPGVEPMRLRLPARAAHWTWRRTGRPRLAGFDVVHGPNYIVAPAKAARLVTVHDLTAWRFPKMVNKWCVRYPEQLDRALRGGAHVHTVSQHVADELEAELGVDPDRLHVVPNGFVPSAAGSRRRGLQMVGAQYVLAIGTIEPRKDYSRLVEAMTAIWEVDPKLKLVIAGGDGWGREDLDATISRFGAEQRVVLTGYVDEATKSDLMAGAELLAYPSLYEGFGLPVLEAMYAGLPVVATNAGAIPEVAGSAAMLVDPGDASALASAIISVLEDPTLRRRMVAAGRQQADGFSWDRTADGLGRLYRRLAAGR